MYEQMRIYNERTDENERYCIPIVNTLTSGGRAGRPAGKNEFKAMRYPVLDVPVLPSGGDGGDG